MNRPDITVVLPMMNEREIVPELHRRLTSTLEGMGVTHELLFVDDGSTDGTREALRALSKEDPRVHVLVFSRNFGHHCAMTAGMDYSRGNAVVLMDSDLQDRPEELPRFWERYREGYDVVFAEVDSRKEGLFKALLGRGFWLVFGLFTGIHLSNPGVYRIISRRTILALRQYSERARFLAGIFALVGFRQTTIRVERAPRAAGKSKYNFAKMLALCLFALTSFSRAPLRMAALLSGMFSVGSIGLASWVLYRKLVYGTFIGWASLAVITLLGFAGTFLVLGVIGEYIATILQEVKSRPLYLVEEHLGGAVENERAS